MKNRIRNFDIQTKLGSGSYGVIYKAINKTTKEVCVLKQISLSRLSEKAKKSAINEATIMGKLVHPFIVHYQQSFIEQNTLNIVMQYCDNGDLNNYLKLQNKRPLKQQKIWKFFIEICVGLEYIHKNKILHRDIKSLNIFMNKNEQIKIGDLGVAKMLTSNEFAQTMVGTPFYLSPELCEEKPYNQKSDIWAMGCLLYELCTFRHPFEAQNQASLILKIIRGKYTAIPQFYSKELKEIIDLCLERDYKRRPTASNILSKPKIQEMTQQFGINKIVQEYLKGIKKQAALVPSKSIQQQKPKTALTKPNNEPKKIVKALDGDVKKQNQKEQIKKEQAKKQNVKDQLVKKVEKQKEDIKRQPIIILPPKPQAASQKKMEIESRRLTEQNFEAKKQNKNEFMSNLGKMIDNQSKKQQHHAHSYGQLPSNQLLVKKQEKRQKLIQKIVQIKKDVKSSQAIKNADFKKQTPAIPQKKSNYIDSSQVKKLENNKQSSILSKPPIPPSNQNKQGVIKVKNEKAIQAKVYQSQRNVTKPQGVIKSGGFNAHLQSKERLQINKESNSKEKGSYQKIHSAKRPSQQPLIKIEKQKQQKKQLFGVSPAVQRKSEKIIKAPSVTPSLIVEERRKQDISKMSRVRKGGKTQLARNARNASRYKQVSKQEQDMIINLPTNVNKNGAASSDSQQDYSTSNIQMQDSKRKTNKSKFQLKQINDDLVLQKYEDLMRNEQQKTKQQKDTNREFESQSSQELSSQFDKQIAQESANQNLAQQAQDDNIVQDLQNLEGRRNSNQAIEQALEDEMNAEIEQQDVIQDESKQEQNEWSYDEQPELPMLQEKESPYFEQNNPYLVQQQQKTQNKINHLQIKLQQNMKRQDQINKLMQLKIDQCKKFIGNEKILQEILQFFRKKLHMDDEYNEEDEKEVQIFLKRKGLTDHYKFQNIYKIMHFEMQLDNTRKIIQRICKKLTQLQNEC